MASPLQNLRTKLLVQNYAVDHRHAGRDHVELFGCTARKVDDSVGNERSTVVNLNDTRIAGSTVGNQEFGSERKASVSSGQTILVETAAIGGASAMESATVPGRSATKNRFSGRFQL